MVEDLLRRLGRGDDAELIGTIIDSDGSGCIDVLEWFDLCEMLDAKIIPKRDDDAFSMFVKVPLAGPSLVSDK